MGLLSKLFGADETRVEVEGRAAEATIVSLSEGGPYVNDRPTITMALDVETSGGERYRVEARQNVGRLVIGRLRPGVTIPVRVDPEDSARVVIDEPALLARPDAPVGEGDPLETLHRLAELRDGGAITEEEFAVKKAEILRDL